MPIPLPPIRTPEPRAIVAFIKAGHPWMALAISMAWLLSSVAIVAMIFVAIYLR